MVVVLVLVVVVAVVMVVVRVPHAPQSGVWRVELVG